MARVIAIDLGRRAVKVTVMQGTGRNATVEGRFAEPVVGETARHLDWEARLGALDALLQSHPAWVSGSSSFALAWPSDAVTVRRFRLPFADRAKVERALPFEVEAQVPFDLDDMVLTYRLLGGEGYTDVLVALARKDALRSVLEALSERKIDPRHVYLDVDVLADAAPRQGTVAMLDLGHEHATLVVVRDGVMQWCHALSVGGKEFLNAIATRTGATLAEVEQRFSGDAGLPAAWPELPEPLREALNAPLGLLLTEVRSSLIVAEDALGMDIDAVRVCGGLARLAPLTRVLAQDLGVPVELAVEGEAIGSIGQLIADGLAYRVAGNAAPTDLNLRVGELAYRGGADLRAVMTFGGAGLAFFAVASLGLFAWRYQQLSNDLSAMHARTQELVFQIAPEADATSAAEGRAVTAVSDKVTDAKARAKAFERSDLPPTVDVLARLSEAFPPKGQGTVDVMELTITPENISFNAEADGYTSAAAVEESLRKVDAFREATKGNEKKNREKVNFTVTIPLGAEGAPKQEG